MVRMLSIEFRSAAPATNHFGDLLRPINSMSRACAACLICSDPDNEQFIILFRAWDLVWQAFLDTRVSRRAVKRLGKCLQQTG